MKVDLSCMHPKNAKCKMFLSKADLNVSKSTNCLAEPLVVSTATIVKVEQRIVRFNKAISATKPQTCMLFSWLFVPHRHTKPHVAQMLVCFLEARQTSKGIV